jgi:MFS family permease
MQNWPWYIANLVNFLAMACHMSSTLLPVYWKQSGFQDWEIGWVAAGFSSAAIVSRLGLGYGLEQWGRKPFLLLGGALLTLSAGFYPFLGEDFSLWLGVRLLQGIGLGCFMTAMLTWVADRSPSHRVGELQGIFGVSGLVGSAVGPMVSEYTYRAFGFVPMFWSLLGTGLVCFVLICLLPETHAKSSSPGSAQETKLQLSDHRAMLCVTVPFGWFVGTLITFIAPYLESVKLPKVGLYFAAFAVASVAVRVFAGTLIDTTEPGRLVRMSGGLLVLSASSIALLQAYPSTLLLITAAVLNGFGHGFLFPGLSSLTVKRTTTRQRGAGLALFTGVFDLGILAGALCSGYIAQAAGYSTAFFVGSAFLLMSLPLFAKLNSPVS